MTGVLKSRGNLEADTHACTHTHTHRTPSETEAETGAMAVQNKEH